MSTYITKAVTFWDGAFRRKNKTEKEKKRRKKTGVKKKDRGNGFDLKETLDKCQEGNGMKTDTNIKRELGGKRRSRVK